MKKIPGLTKLIPKKGLLTSTEINKDDKSASFAYILNLYTQPAQKTFVEAKGDVITDYQNALDKKWVAELKKKYNVVIDEKVLNSILK